MQRVARPPQVEAKGLLHPVSPHDSRAYVFTPLSHLLPPVQQALEEARQPDGWDEQRLNQIIRHEFGFLGPFTAARIERGVPSRPPDEEVLVIEFSPPAGRDLVAAERRFGKATTRAQRGEVRQVLEDLKQLVADFPEVAKYHRALGQAHLVLEEHGDAEGELLSSLALDPRDPDALTLLGNLYTKSKAPAKAIPLYERSLQIQRNVYALTNLGAALAETGRPKESSVEGGFCRITELGSAARCSEQYHGLIFKTVANGLRVTCGRNARGFRILWSAVRSADSTERSSRRVRARAGRRSRPSRGR